MLAQILSLTALLSCTWSQEPTMLMYPKTGMAQLPSSKANMPSDIYIRLVLEAKKNVTLTMSGPSNKWFALGFGQSMYLTEAIIFSTGKTGKEKGMARTYHLSNEGSDGVNVNPQLQWMTLSQKESNGRINVTVTRPLFVDASNIQEFDMGETMINVIWARGKGMTLVEHEQKERPIHLDMVSGTAKIGTTPHHDRRRPPPPRRPGNKNGRMNHPPPPPPGGRGRGHGPARRQHRGANPTMLAWPAVGMKELPSSQPGNLSEISIRLVFDATVGNATLIMAAPVGKWFALGFGQSMYLTEAVIFSTGKNGTDKAMARTYHLHDESSDGVSLNPMQIWETKYQAVNNGTQIVTVTRPLFVDAQNVTEFDLGEMLVNVIWARGHTLKLVEHEQKERPIHLTMTDISSRKRAQRIRDRLHRHH